MRNGTEAEAPGWARTPSGEVDHAAIEARARALRGEVLRALFAAAARRLRNALAMRHGTGEKAPQSQCPEAGGCHT